MEHDNIIITSSDSKSQNANKTIHNFSNTETSLAPPITTQTTHLDNLPESSATSPSQSSFYIPHTQEFFQNAHQLSLTTTLLSPIMSLNDLQTSSQQSNNWSKIFKLTASTFFNWKRRLETTLSVRSLSNKISEDIAIPVEAKQRAYHIVNDLKAPEVIQSSCDVDIFNVISNCSTAKASYVTLYQYHDDFGGLKTANMFSKIASSCLASASDLKYHFMELCNTHTRVKSNLQSTPGLIILNPLIVISLLKTLPAKLNSIFQTSQTNLENLASSQLYTL